MKKLIYTTILSTFFSIISFSQNISEFDNVTNLITEDFTNAETAFPILTSLDNYFIIDNGDYLLSRNNTESEYAIIASTTQQISDFMLKTAIKLGPSSNKRASCGIIIKSQTTSTGALIFEINRKGEYRIKELLINNTYKYLSGKTSNNGWVKSKIVKNEGEFNAIKILCEKNIYDIYVNNTFLTSFFSPSIEKGNMGILIGRDAKSRIAYYYLSIPAKPTNNLIENHMNDLSVINLHNKIKQLESEILTIKNNNERLEKENTYFKNDNRLNQSKKHLEEARNIIDSLNLFIKNLKIEVNTSNNILKEERTNLNRIKEEMNREINSLNSDINSKQNRINDLILLNKELNNTNKKINEENSSLSGKNSIIQNDLNNAEDNLKLFKNKNSELNNESIRLKSEITSNESIKNKLNAKVTNLNTEISDLKSKLSSEKLSNANSEKKLKENISYNKKEIEKLKQEVASANKKTSLIQEKYSKTNNLRENNKSLTSSLMESENIILSLNNEVNELNEKVKKIEKERGNLIISENNKSEEISLLSSTIDDLYTKVENMKKVLIYKGFEEGGIDSENITSTKIDNNTEKRNKKKKEKENISNDVTYTVQIATYGSKVTFAKFKGLKDVFYIDSENETYLYMSGRFNNSNAAVEHKKKLIEIGYKDAFIVELKNK